MPFVPAFLFAPPPLPPPPLPPLLLIGTTWSLHTHTSPPPPPSLCGSDRDLVAHIMTMHHPGEGVRVTCPICASMPHGNPTQKSSNIFGHMEARHGDLLPSGDHHAPDDFSFEPSSYYRSSRCEGCM
jgi:hypothetical protein